MLNQKAYDADMQKLRKDFKRVEKDNWAVAETIHYWTTQGIDVNKVGADSGMGPRNAGRFRAVWEYFGKDRIEGESFYDHAYLAVASEEKAVKLLVEAELSSRSVTNLHRVMTNAVLAEASEEHSSNPEALVTAERVADKLATNPRLANAARSYARTTREKTAEKERARADARQAATETRSKASSTGTTLLAAMLEEAVKAVRLVNQNDGHISDFDRLGSVARELGEELHVYAAKRGLDTSLADLLGSVA